MTSNPDGTFEVTCKEGYVEHNVTSEAIRSDAVCAARPHIWCRLAYFLYSTTCPDMYCEPVEIVESKTEFRGFLDGQIDVGGDDLPYKAWLKGYPDPNAHTPVVDRGIFQSVIQERASGQRHSVTTGWVSLAGLQVSGGVSAGSMRSFVDEFQYQGKTYNVVDFACSAVRAGD